METISKYALLVFKKERPKLFSPQYALRWANASATGFCKKKKKRTMLMLDTGREGFLKVPIAEKDHGLRAQFVLRMGLSPDLLQGTHDAVVCARVELAEPDGVYAQSKLCIRAVKCSWPKLEPRRSAKIVVQ
jgi:hypothetical protein